MPPADAQFARLETSALADITAVVFSAMFGIETELAEPAHLPRTGRITAAVHLYGDWAGAILVECTRKQAKYFARQYVGSADEFPAHDVVCDVLGELANVIGGNLKGTLGKAIQLSLPAVVEGEHCYRVCQANSASSVWFRCAEGTFRVTAVTGEI